MSSAWQMFAVIGFSLGLFAAVWHLSDFSVHSTELQSFTGFRRLFADLSIVKDVASKSDTFESDVLQFLSTGEVNLRTVNYNVFGRWPGVTGYEGQDVRLAAIPSAIAADPDLGPDVDIITIDEAWCPNDHLITGDVMCGHNASRQTLINAFKDAHWPYHTAVADKPGVSITSKQTNGGAMIFSKWPILATSQWIYKSCTSSDCNAAKGAVYARILKTDPVTLASQVINIIGTHMQAWSTPEGETVRQNQLRELYNDFIPAIGVPTDGTEVFLFQGDMNIDAVLYPEEVVAAEAILHATQPPTTGSQKFTSNPSTNYLVGKDGGSNYGGCFDDYKASLNVALDDSGIVPVAPTAPCTKIPKTTAAGGPIDKQFLNDKGELDVGDDCRAYCPCCDHEKLDYIMYSTDSAYLQPTSKNFRIVPLKSVKPLTYKWGWCHGASCVTNAEEVHDLTGNDLSDHYPIVANFKFKPVASSFPLLNGCKWDQDCAWHPSFKQTCYCSGSGCSWDNKYVNGWDLGSSHPVNRNCHYKKSPHTMCWCRPGNS